MEQARLQERDEYVDVDTLYILDVDRCFLDTRKAQRILEGVADTLAVDTVDTDDMRSVRAEMESSGGSFDTLGYLRERMPEDQFKQVVAQFVEVCRQHNVLEDGAEEMLSYLVENNLPFVFWTYGGDEWQEAKLEGGQLDEYDFTVMQTKLKGWFLKGCYNKKDDVYEIPATKHAKGYRARSIVTMDDKQISYSDTANLPRVTNYHILPANENHQVASQTEIAPLQENTIQVRGMGEALMRLLHRNVDKK